MEPAEDEVCFVGGLTFIEFSIITRQDDLTNHPSGFTTLKGYSGDVVREGSVWAVGLIVHRSGRAGIIWEEVLMAGLFHPTRLEPEES